MRWKRIASLLLAVLLAGSAVGCVGADGEIYGEKEVLEYVDTLCQEPYELLDSELIQQTPDNMEYHFRTTDRGLEFKANSYLSPIIIDASTTPFYTKEISCDYLWAVQELYYDEAAAKIAASSCCHPDTGWLYLTSFSQIDAVVDAILAADKVYLPEQEYNGLQFMRENPLMRVHLVWYPSQEAAQQNKTWVNITDLPVNGQNERQGLYDRIANLYAQLCVDKKIDDLQVPQNYLAGKHRSWLDQIELDGAKMEYADQDNPYNPYGLTTDDYLYSWYNEEEKSYMMVSDIGFYSDGSSMPLIIREYVRALGGQYSLRAEEDRFFSSWTIGQNHWEMESVYEDGIQSVTLTRNGKRIPLQYLTTEEDHNVKASFCIGLTADQFCSLFDLRYEVDEENGKILFFSKE